MAITRRGGAFIVRVTGPTHTRAQVGGTTVEFAAESYMAAAAVERFMELELTRAGGLAEQLQRAAQPAELTLQNALDLTWGKPNAIQGRVRRLERSRAAEIVETLGPDRPCRSIRDGDLERVRAEVAEHGKAAARSYLEAFERLVRAGLGRQRGITPAEALTERERLERRREVILRSLGQWEAFEARRASESGSEQP